MRLKVMGCSGSMAGPQSPASGYLVSQRGTGGADDVHIMLDIGLGSTGPLQATLELERLNALILSHTHPDHCGDFWTLYVARRYFGWSDGNRLTVYGPRGTGSRLAQWVQCSTDELAEHFDVREVSGGSVATIGAMTVNFFDAWHTTTALCVRLESAQADTGYRSLAYSGDTDDCEGLRGAAAGVDALLCEASFTEDMRAERGIHMTGRRAGAVAEATGARSLIITHVPPRLDPVRMVQESREVYGGPVHAAELHATYPASE